ncbi:MAG: hypothetical protein PHW24_00690 [Candidatus Moranbacteria bacterium]|nr:hypothetical protein [Candidatus Moranbacteria bacterium]
MTDIKKITESKYFKIVLGLLGCFIAAVIVFAAGVHVGERRAKYSYQWGANYERNFIGGPREMMGGQRIANGPMDRRAGGPIGMMRGFEGRDFRNAHGIAGVVTSITDNNVVIKDRDGKENTIAVSDKTIIKNRQADLKITDLKSGDNLVVVGNPGDNGVVNADLIRVF